MRYAEGIQNYSDRSCQTIYSVSSDLGPIQAGSKEQRQHALTLIRYHLQAGDRGGQSRAEGSGGDHDSGDTPGVALQEEGVEGQQAGCFGQAEEGHGGGKGVDQKK